MALPQLSAEDRASALQKAKRVRTERAEVKGQLKVTVTLPDVLTRAATDDMVGKTKVSALLESMPGVGKVRARQIMERLGIAENRRARGLGSSQVEALRRLAAVLPSRPRPPFPRSAGRGRPLPRYQMEKDNGNDVLPARRPRRVPARRAPARHES